MILLVDQWNSRKLYSTHYLLHKNYPQISALKQWALLSQFLWFRDLSNNLAGCLCLWVCPAFASTPLAGAPGSSESWARRGSLAKPTQTVVGLRAAVPHWISARDLLNSLTQEPPVGQLTSIRTNKWERKRGWARQKMESLCNLTWKWHLRSRSQQCPAHTQEERMIQGYECQEERIAGAILETAYHICWSSFQTSVHQLVNKHRLSLLLTIWIIIIWILHFTWLPFFLLRTCTSLASGLLCFTEAPFWLSEML